MTLRAAGRAVCVTAVTALAVAALGCGAKVESAARGSAEVLGARVAAPGAGAGDAVRPGWSGELVTAGTVGGGAETGGGEDAGGAGESSRSASGPSGTGVWAVVVGVDHYPESPDLRAGVTDAQDMDAALEASGVPASQRRVLLDGAGTSAAVREAFDWLAANAGPRATAVFFFSGHVREVDGDPDADGEAVDEGMLFADQQIIFDGEVADLADRLASRRIWLNIAGCYAGGFDDAMAPGRLLTGASAEGVLAYENDKFQRTYLVEYMVRRAMLQGAASGSVQEAFAWAVEALRRDYPNRLPVMFDQLGEPLVIGPAPASPPPPSPSRAGITLDI